LRVIAGQYKGHRLFTAKGNWLRPTSDRNKEFLFSYLGNLVEQSTILDLFAGTGNLGLEALSRGANFCTFVEHEQEAVSLIKKNIIKLNCADRTQVFCQSVDSFIKYAGKLNRLYDLVFADPPYAFTPPAELFILARNILLPDGLFVFETSSRTSSWQIQGYSLIKEKLLGDSKILVWQNE
jgi:16S rRNA (guanine966-N2)-methyltransferase